MTMADVPGQYGANNCPMETFSGSTRSPGVLYPEMRSESQRRICMVFKIAGKPSVFFSLLTRHISNIVTILKLIYCFKQNQATAPLRSPSDRSPTCWIGRICLIHSVGGANGSPWWWWLGVVLCFEKRKKTYYSYVKILQCDSF